MLIYSSQYIEIYYSETCNKIKISYKVISFVELTYKIKKLQLLFVILSLKICPLNQHFISLKHKSFFASTQEL